MAKLPKNPSPPAAPSGSAEELRRYDLLLAGLDLLDQGLAVFDSAPRLVAWNKAFLRLLEFPESMVRVGTPFEDFVRYNAERGEYGVGESEGQVSARMSAVRAFQPHYTERIRPNGDVLAIHGVPIRPREELRQVDTGVACAEGTEVHGRIGGTVGRVHTTVAVQRDPEGAVGVDGPRISEVRNRERVLVAFHGAGEIGIAAKWHRRAAAHGAVGVLRVLARRREDREAGIHAITDVKRPGRIGCCGERILRQGDAGTRHTFVLGAETVRKIAIAGLSGGRQEACRGQCGDNEILLHRMAP